MRLYPFSPLVLYVAGCSLTESGKEDALLPHSPAIAQASAQAPAPHPLAPRRPSPNANPPRIQVGPRDTSHIDVPPFSLPSPISRSDVWSILGPRSFSQRGDALTSETGRNVVPRGRNRIHSVRQSLIEHSRALSHNSNHLPNAHVNHSDETDPPHGDRQGHAEDSGPLLDQSGPLSDALQGHSEAYGTQGNESDPLQGADQRHFDESDALVDGSNPPADVHEIHSEEVGAPLDVPHLVPDILENFTHYPSVFFDESDLPPMRATAGPMSWPSFPLLEPLSGHSSYRNRDTFAALAGYAFDVPTQQSQPVRALTHLRDDRDEEDLAPQTPPRHDEDEQNFQTPERRAPMEFPPESYQTPQSRINRTVLTTPPPIHGRSPFTSPLTPEENGLRNAITRQRASRRRGVQQTSYVSRSLGSMLRLGSAQEQELPLLAEDMIFAMQDQAPFQAGMNTNYLSLLNRIRLMIQDNNRLPTEGELAYAQECAESLGIEPSPLYSRTRLDLLSRAPYFIYSESLPAEQFDVAADVRPGCGICGEDYQPGEAVVSVAGCVKHHGHRTCLSMWLALPDKTCPYCRQNPFASELPAPYAAVAEPGTSDRELEDVDMVVPDSANYVDEQLTCGELPNFHADSLPNLYDD